MKETIPSHTPAGDPRFFPVSPLMIFPKAVGSFSVYLRQGNTLVLYAAAGEAFTERHRLNLFENGVREVYVLLEQRENYTRYVEENLGAILQDESIPLPERAGTFYRASTEILRAAFEARMPVPLDSETFRRLHYFVTQSIRFLTSADSLRALGEFIAHDYKTYTHSINVFIYTMPLAQTLGLDDAALIRVGIGTLLHDVGMTRVPKTVIERAGRLTPDEEAVYRTHPAQGVATIAQVPLTQEAINCILFHHERMDGSGYPTGLSGDQIPPVVRALAVADTFDTLISTRGGLPAATSAFEVLNRMRAEMASTLDMEMFRRFVLVLSGAMLDGGFGAGMD
ncbi:HD-GYP domain-containing protein [Nitratidesulfovibrio sp. D1]|uniref:HD-GYP domain-containing protein n=1 Tax=unclassified Nitratidesulfovibrio TaxID=2802296 RepID=UPI002FD8902F